MRDPAGDVQPTFNDPRETFVSSCLEPLESGLHRDRREVNSYNGNAGPFGTSIREKLPVAAPEVNNGSGTHSTKHLPNYRKKLIAVEGAAAQDVVEAVNGYSLRLSIQESGKILKISPI
jgi:hypothetical protein